MKHSAGLHLSPRKTAIWNRERRDRFHTRFSDSVRDFENLKNGKRDPDCSRAVKAIGQLGRQGCKSQELLAFSMKWDGGWY